VTLYRLGPGEFCGASVVAAMNGGITYINAEARGKVEMVSLPISVFKRVFSGNPVVQERVLKVISQRTETLLSLIEGITFVRMESRIANYLLQKCVPGDDGEPVVKSSHADIAMDLGSAREVVSRILKSFKTKGAVDLARSQIRLLETEMLEELAV
jgi:CRP/FNR family transcriptional regulator